MTEYLTTRGAGDIIQMSEDYVARQCEQGNIVATKLGNTWRITREALDAFMAPSTSVPPARVGRTARQRRRSS